MSTIVSIYCALAVWRRMAIQQSIVLSTSDSAAGDMNMYERLTAELAAAIRGGELAGGSALPPGDFARLRGIGPSTAARVASLRQQGLVIGEVGRGTFVRAADGCRPAVGGGQVRVIGPQRRGAGGAGAARRAQGSCRPARPGAADRTGQPLGRTSIQRALAAFRRNGLDVPPERICVAHGGQAALRLALAIAQRAAGGGRRHHLSRLEARRQPARPGPGTDRLRRRRSLAGRAGAATAPQAASRRRCLHARGASAHGLGHAAALPRHRRAGPQA